MINRLAIFAATFCAVSAFSIAQGAEPLLVSGGTARLDTYEKDNTVFFALSIEPKAEDMVALTTDVVVLFDTSASQSGEYRTAALETLDNFLKNLGDNNTVKLVAVDVDANTLTDSFLAPQSAQMQNAFAKLNRRVPLGSTNMAKAIRAATESFTESGSDRRAVLYIGDGLSAAKTTSSPAFQAEVAECRKKQIPINSYAIGPNTDVLFLATLANQTGGRLLSDGSSITPEIAGNHLVKAVRGTVIWPEESEINWPEGVTAYPAPLQPLRTDRDNIVVGKGKAIAGATVNIPGIIGEQQMQLQFNIPESAPNDANSYLPHLIEMASKPGNYLPTLGTQGLGKVRNLVARNVESLNRLAQSAQAVGDPDAAQRLSARANELDPEDPQANRNANVDPTTTASDAPDPRSSQENLLEEYIASSGDGISKVENRQKVVTGAIKSDVTVELEKANRLMDSDPGSVEAQLKLVLQNVSQAPDLDPDVRMQLENKLRSAIRLASIRKQERETQMREEQEVLAQRQDREQRIKDLGREEEKITQLMARFDSLMKEDLYQEAEQVMVEVEESTEKNPILADPAFVSASQNAHNAMMYFEYMRTIESANRMRARAFLDVEQKSIPMPDDPPITYPDGEVWREMTLRRQKYASVDLQDRSTAEKNITKALDSPVPPGGGVLEFDEQPLDIVLETLQDAFADTNYPINIVLDTQSLNEIIDTDNPPVVTIKVSGISLRSALRLILRRIEEQLTYTIRDEVLLITTKENSAEQLITKVYPVADLVLPIVTNLGASGGFGSNQGGGMMGFGGMGGGMGAGQGGQGGGGMGGGMGGGGMGGGGMGGGGMGGGGGGMFSDRRLKTHIKLMGTSPSGITIYQFRYVGGGPLYQGVLAQELLDTHPNAVVRMPGGYYGVLYEQIDVNFIQLPESAIKIRSSESKIKISQ